MTAPKTPPVSLLITILICATVGLVAAVAGLVALVVLAPSGTDVVAIITAVGVAVAGAIAGLATFLQGRSTNTKVTSLTNGLLDAKIRAAIADVLHPDSIKSDAATADQLSADRARRAGGR